MLLQSKMGVRLAYVPRGPVLNWQDEDEVRAMMDALKEEGRRLGSGVLKVEPELTDTVENRELMARLGFRASSQSIQPRSTIVVDLRTDPESILQGMKSKWRYNVRLAERKGVRVRVCEAGDLASFEALMQETAARDAFDVHEASYYRSAFELIAPGHAVFLMAEYEGTPLAAIVVAQVGCKAWYLWGASGERERNRMPNHALQWAGMLWAKERGAQWYDTWGIPDELGILAQGLRGGDGSGTPVEEMPVDVESLPGHGLWGVYRFKQGFGGMVVRSVGAWDVALTTSGFALYRAGLKALDAKRTLEHRRNGASSGDAAANSRHAQIHAVSDAQTWRKALATLAKPHVLQSWEWGEVKSQTEWRAERFVLGDGVGAFQLLTRQPVAGVPLHIGYIPKGPVVDWEDAVAVDSMLQAVEEAARRRRCVLVKIDPSVAEESVAGRRLKQRLGERGWLFSNEQIQFKNTATSDLSVGAEALLEGMKSKHRYNVRLAERRGIQVRVGDVEDLGAFYALYAETGARDGFIIRPREYYEQTWRRFLAAQQEVGNPAGGALLLAEHEDESAPVAGLFLLRYGATAWYFYGASSERRRRDMPNYLLQWEAVRWAIAQGCTCYDWWGAPTNPDDESDSMQGVWGFKQGFGAQLDVGVGAWDFPVSRTLYAAYREALPQVVGLMRRRARNDRVTPVP